MLKHVTCCKVTNCGTNKFKQQKTQDTWLVINKTRLNTLVIKNREIILLTSRRWLSKIWRFVELLVADRSTRFERWLALPTCSHGETTLTRRRMVSPFTLYPPFDAIVQHLCMWEKVHIWTLVKKIVKSKTSHFLVPKGLTLETWWTIRNVKTHPTAVKLYYTLYI